MKEYKRLTDSETAVMLKNTEGSSWDSEEMEAQRYIRLAELEDKIDSGTLIELGCKVGDTIYKTIIEFPRIDEFVVKRICFQDIFPYRYVLSERVSDKAWVSFYPVNFGETAFLTKAEAEAKLKELKGE